jgi:beta-mannanase
MVRFYVQWVDNLGLPTSIASTIQSRAWRHVHAIFTTIGATNVKWMWTQNVEYSGSTALSSVFPGDSYFDMTRVDGYNRGITQSWSSWQMFSQVFDATIADIKSITKASRSRRAVRRPPAGTRR